ncbi:hypothetical protein DPQ33_13690 [Oceanidesulfovibrio indonesiensis]|uniref:DUF4115 domain-containing protein n=1 Tax=Oceanidesulfovibrio indonesiensis TaxID=54767 RepID=A0A7M3MCE4_9BACT|nr:hypothetical protein [Oceanidesulfovibrio indonesiensis]TVM16010.1 hypothetical protein DPQ33_13690 [Oceanidesulfovibrio indonesiensis]
MRTKLNLVMLALLFAVSGCSFAGNSEAVSLENIEPGVQKVTPLVDRNTFLPQNEALKPWYRMYDDQTGQWYPARQNAAGEWELTKKGADMRKDDLESLANPDEDKITQWRNDTTGFTYSPQLMDTNAEGQGIPARPAPQLDLERKRAADTDTIVEEPATEPANEAPAIPASDESTPENAVERSSMDNASPADPASMDQSDTVTYGLAGNSAASDREVAVSADASTLTLEGINPTWVSALIDGGGKRDYFIRSGQTIDLFFGSSLSLEVGESSSVAVYLDGEPYELSPEGTATIRKP